MKYNLILLTLLFFGCAGAPSTHNHEDNTELVVHYNGKEVHRRGGKWVSESELALRTKNHKEIIVIFGADWCKACNLTRKIIKKINIKTKVYYLNFDEPWVKKIAYLMQIKAIPYMVHSKDSGKFEAHRIGPGLR